MGITPFSALEQWLRDFCQGVRQTTRTESSEALPKGTDYLKQNVGKFKPKDALKNTGDVGGKRLSSSW